MDGVSRASSSRSSCGADPRRVDRLDEVRAWQVTAGEQIRGPDAHDLGAVHVAVHDLGPPALEQVGNGGGSLVIGLGVHHLDTETERSPARGRHCHPRAR